MAKLLLPTDYIVIASAFGFVALGLVVGLILRKRNLKKLDEFLDQFAQKMSPLGLTQTVRFYKRYTFAYGKFCGIQTSLMPSFYSRSDWMPTFPMKADKVWFINMKIPGTAGLKAHFGFLNPVNTQNAVRKFLGWKKLDENVFMVEKWSPDGASIYQKLTPQIKNQIESLSRRYATNVSLSHDWDVKFLGAEKAKVLAGGDSQIQNCLTLQIIISKINDLPEALGQTSSLVGEISKCLKLRA